MFYKCNKPPDAMHSSDFLMVNRSFIDSTLCFSFCGKISLIHDLSCFILIRPSKTEQNSQTWEEEPRSDTIAGVTVSSGCWLASCDQGQVCCQVCVGRG